ncbi:outer membrane lipoprotein carrier protein LolA [Pseudomonas sp. 8O]|uniref:outer membrane lipoprotein carrier protein LolA n=1 Tax=Pseudomonas sp. 8O TaxID=2653165 RepID=UPI002115A2D1|nr:outer membrane lipoprotein carrier protein LolA [Pseudomonas sp. 8O]
MQSGKNLIARCISRIISGLLLAGLAQQAMAFDLDQLSAQLGEPEVVRGSFIQEKHLRALPQPLTSRGHFVLAKDHGLLWLLERPLQQDYRIDAQGIARRSDQGWQFVAQQSATAQQNRLFLAVLKGDSSGLRQDFELSLSGTAEAWQLDLTPRSVLLKQVFKAIVINGGELVQRIELQETQGDSTVLRLEDSQADQSLSDAERHDFQS